MYLWHRIFIVITPWISFYLRLSFAKCQGNCEPLSLRRCILPDLISRIQPFFNIMLCRIFSISVYSVINVQVSSVFIICLRHYQTRLHDYIIELQLFLFFSLFLRKYIYHCQGHEFMHAVTKWKKELIFH